MHHGPYERLGETYAALFGQWLPANGREPGGASCSYEIYLNDPNSTPPEELLTEVCVPLKPA